MLPEDELVERIRAVAGTGDGLVLGIGDDAAVLDGGFVVCCDMLVEGVHFDSSRLSLRQIGARAAAVNLSDLAAMGARPVCLLAAFGCRRSMATPASSRPAWPPTACRWRAAISRGRRR
jgi:thiamine-monophosphate kinase